MRAEQTDHADPFRCYVGRRVSLEACPHVVARYEVHGRDLLFRLRQVDSSNETLVSILELLQLLEREEA